MGQNWLLSQPQIRVTMYIIILKLKKNYLFFSFENVLVENVLLTLRHLQTSKSTGLDIISAKMLKIAAHIIAPSQTDIFNLSLSTGIFINDWKNARDNGKLTGAVFLDIRKAFDSIDHEILLENRKFYGITGLEYMIGSNHIQLPETNKLL